MATTATETLTVKLPYCTKCHRVGKLTREHFGGKEMCAGPIKNPHKTRRMKYRTFELVEEGEE